MSVPSLTIVIPTRNRPALLRRAVASLTVQSVGRFDVVIVDDGSDPPLTRTGSVAGDERFRLIRRNESPGPAAARNCGVLASRSDYVTFLDDDDELAPQFVRTVLATLARTPAIDFLWSSAKIVHDHRGVDEVSFRSFPRMRPGDASLVTAALSIGTGFGLTVRRRALQDVGLFDESLGATEDTDCLIRLLKAGFTPAVVSDPLVIIHDHSGDRLTSARRNGLRIAEIQILLKRHAEFFANERNGMSILVNHLNDLMADRCEGAHYHPRHLAADSTAPLPGS